MSNPPLILASGSKYRLERLQQANLKIIAHPSNIDESPLDNEGPKELAQRLAEVKAKAISSEYKTGLIIGSDQVAVVNVGGKDIILGKPGSQKNAIKQLAMCNGKTITFFTGLSVFDCASGKVITRQDSVKVTFSHLTSEQITRYVETENPINCAGSFMMERAGIFLFEEMTTRDPNALLGIPLIGLRESLSSLGYDIFDFIN